MTNSADSAENLEPGVTGGEQPFTIGDDREDVRIVRREGVFTRLPKSYSEFLLGILLPILGVNTIVWLVIPCTLFVATPVLVGYFAAQIGLVAVWVSLGPRSFNQRAGTWYGMYFAWLIAASLGPLLFVFGNGMGSKEWYRMLGMVLISPMILILAQVPFWLGRFFLSWRIAEHCDRPETPFGVADFLWASVLVALSIGTYQLGIQMMDMDAAEKMAFTIRLVPLTLLLSCLVLVPGTIWMLDSQLDRPRIGVFAFWSFIAVVVTTVALGISLEFGPRVFSGFDFLVATGVVIIGWTGFFGTFLLVMYQAYQAGLRVITAGSRQAEIVYLENLEEPGRQDFDHDSAATGNQG